MIPSVRSSIAGVAIALAVTTVGAVGTAYADVPTASGAATIAAENPPPRPPPPAPHRFRAKFRTQQQCQQRAGHDHPGHRADWDCRRGPDRNNPWEYWGK